MLTIRLTPGSIGFSKGSDRSGHGHAGYRNSVNRKIASVLRNTVHTLARWQQRYEMRRRLLEMDDRTLQDIGLTRTETVRVANRMFRLF